MNIIKNLKISLDNVKGKILSIPVLVSALLSGAVPAFAAEGDSEYVTGISSLWSSITSQINVSSIVSIIGICIGSCIVGVLFWFGLRYVVRKIQIAVKKGKFSA